MRIVRLSRNRASSALANLPSYCRGTEMKFVRAIWKLLVGIKDALVLLLLLLFFGSLYGALSARPAPVREGVLNLDLNGSVVEQPSRRDWSEVAGSARPQEYRLRDLVEALDKAREDSRVKAV